MRIYSILGLMLTFGLNISSAQDAGWHLKAADKDGSIGVAAESMHKQLKGMEGQTVVVAVIDSGIDIEHEDLADNIWVNTGEIPNNGKDDDNNGYIDDVNGWNFIGGPNGNVNEETLEVTRLYARDRYRFENAVRSQLSKSEQKEYDLFIKCKEDIDKNVERSKKSLENYSNAISNIEAGLDAIKSALGDKEITKENIEAVESMDGDALSIGKNILLEQLASGAEVEDIDELKNGLTSDYQGAVDHFSGRLEYYYNPDFDSRHIVGDNYADQTEKYYGNNDVEGPDALHGTHVAGIIGAVRNNDIGTDGVASNVKLMSVRTVPDGDERDKDVANAIRYAVDNGASIINMSFGKAFSWNEKIVEDAIKYAEKNDVLLVHAAGNSHQDNDVSDNFPNDIYVKKRFWILKDKVKTYNNWLEVGALNYKNGEDLAAPFSNYGAKNVDLFAPGMSIHAPVPDNEYQPLQGTSMAAPVVAGVAAVIRSQYPGLTAVQVKNILMSSVTRINQKVKVPGEKDKMKMFSELSISGGVVNAKDALKLAKITPGKKKVKAGKPNRA